MLCANRLQFFLLGMVWNTPPVQCQEPPSIVLQALCLSDRIPYDYTVEVTNRYKGLDMIDRVPEELWTEVHDIVQKAVIKTTPRKRNAKRQNGCLKRPYK